MQGGQGNTLIISSSGLSKFEDPFLTAIRDQARTRSLASTAASDIRGFALSFLGPFGKLIDKTLSIDSSIRSSFPLGQARQLIDLADIFRETDQIANQRKFGQVDALLAAADILVDRRGEELQRIIEGLLESQHLASSGEFVEDLVRRRAANRLSGKGEDLSGELISTTMHEVEESTKSTLAQIIIEIDKLIDQQNAELSRAISLDAEIDARRKAIGQTTIGIVPSDNITGLANGGTVNGPTLALIGEGGLPEAVVPLPDGRSIPVMFIGGGLGGLGELPNVERASDGVAKLNVDLGGLAESSTFLGISAERLLDTFGDVITGTTDLGTALKSLARTVVGSLAGSIGDDIGGTDGDVIGAFISQAGNFLISNFLATGGVMTGGGPLPLSYYGRGGVATSPRLAVFGEGSLPEAFVPLPDGRSIPVTMAGGGFGGGPVLNAPVTVNVQAPGGRDGGSGGFDPAVAQEFSVSIGRAVREEFDRLLHDSMRPGGPLNPIRIN